VTPKKSYSRFFIILQEDEKGYSLEQDKAPSGYAKLEMKNNKCKLSYYVQNMNKQKGPCHMVLICDKKDTKKIMRIAKMNIDDYGRADVTYEYDMNNIANSGIGADKIAGAAIVKFDGSKIACIMHGFITSDVSKDWKGYEVISEEDMKPMPREIRFDKYEQQIEAAKENNIEQSNTAKNDMEESNTAKNDIEENNIEKSDVVKSDVYEQRIEAVKENNLEESNTAKNDIEEINIAKSDIAKSDAVESDIEENIATAKNDIENSELDEEMRKKKHKSDCGCKEKDDHKKEEKKECKKEEKKKEKKEEKMNECKDHEYDKHDHKEKKEHCDDHKSKEEHHKEHEHCDDHKMKKDCEHMKEEHDHEMKKDCEHMKEEHDHEMKKDCGHMKKDYEYMKKDCDYMEKEYEYMKEDCNHMKKDYDHEHMNKYHDYKMKKDCDYMEKEYEYMKEDCDHMKPGHDHMNKYYDHMKKGCDHMKENHEHMKKDYGHEMKKDYDHEMKKHYGHEMEKHYDHKMKHECYPHHEEHEKMYEEKDTKSMMTKFFKGIVKEFEKMDKYDDIKNCVWYKIPVEKMEEMYCMHDYKKYTVIYYPMICYYPYIAKHKHFMIGHKYDSNGNLKYIVYALPGKKSESDQPYGGKTGFVAWMPHKDDMEMGYWLMFYDFKNSTVVVPVRR